MKTTFLFLRITCIALVMVLFPLISTAGNIQFNNSKSGITIKVNSYQKLTLTSSVSGFSFSEVSSPAGLFTMLNIDGAGKRTAEGEPALPVFRRLIEVPVNAGFKINIVKQHYQEIDLGGLGSGYPVFPAQPPLSKGDDPEKVPFSYNKALYYTNGWVADNLAEIVNIGTLRALNLARIDLNPVQYNPVEGTLRIYDELEVEIVFQHANIPATLDLKTKKASPYFNSLYQLVENFKPLPFSDELIAASPVTYVIVSDPMFQSALQPFIAWKKMKGFRVIEGYTSDPAVGTTTTSIKAWLQGLYLTPPAGYNAPSFVLIVGDVAQIPAWAGLAGSHYTDLRYCEYTGDNLPEVYYGRFSATTVAQLQPQIDKTLEYEKYQMPDPSFLNEAVMAAGADASYQTYSNGQIYYGTENYFNLAHGITSHTYLQPEPSGGNYSQNIKNNVSAGVAYANYTAHCSSSGWADPSFVISDIPALANAHKYCLMVGNCCLSAKFDVSSFAEEQLRAADKGSVGYIGGSNNTYWDEDYWWGCGFKSVVLHPAYDAAHIGAYDGTFHDHGEPIADWFVTQGQMVVCGNFAVEESSSSRKQYYWEIYHLMGDPSLMIYYAVPPALTATYQNPLMIGMTSLAVATQPYAYIALSMNGVLLDAVIADATGAATLNFTPLNTPGMADIVITKQNRQPLISTIQVIPAAGPYVIYTASTISDPLPGGNNNGLMDYNETNLLNVSMKNVGVQSAGNVVATLSTPSPYITVTDNSENFGAINPDQVVTINQAFTYTVAENIPDQQVVPFTIQAVSGSGSWNSQFNITAIAPALQIGAMTVLDNGPGCDNDGILDPGETANLVIATTNAGHSGVSNVQGTLAFTAGTSPYLVINNSGSTLGTLATGGAANAVFSVTANPATPIGTPVELTYVVSGGLNGQYTASAVKQVVIGLIPTYIMSTSSVTTCTGYFYDPGGPNAAYSDSQDFTMVINPGTAGSMLRVIFTTFELESESGCGYDFLKIYDGNSVSAALLGTWCGTASPGTIVANNATGSLTFVFHSDGSVTKPGWEASLSCLSGIVPNPLAFAATPATTTQIDLSWMPNIANHDIMLVYALTNVFGTPVNGTVYTVGNALAGGGTVIFKGSGTSFNHTGLTPNTTCYYKAFSLDGTNNYSSGLTASANTACGMIDIFPWTESFENAGVIPSCWSQEFVTLPGLNWTFVKGNGSANPGTAHSGNYNGCLKDASSADNKTRLVSPRLNLSDLPQPQLKFWHTQAYWSPDQDLLSVYYKNTASGTWTLLASYTSNISSWTQETISLPNASANYYICFEGNAKYGYGVCLDDVEISTSCTAIYPVSVSVGVNANPVCAGTEAAFSATAVNGGTTPAYQWRLNGTDVPGATAATWTMVPLDNDLITCRLNSVMTCVSGNPATSVPIAMAVNPLAVVSITISPDTNPVGAGIPVTFTAFPVNGGTIPQYQWFVNGLLSGSGGTTFTFTPQDGDVISCTMTSDLLCTVENPVTSNEVVMTVASVPPNVTIHDLTITGLQCFDATQTITVAGNGHNFTVADGGFATMIAGQNIVYLPGTAVNIGGSMHGYIAPEGPFCQDLKMVSTTVKGNPSPIVSSSSCRVFPNPTSNTFRMELIGISQTSGVRVHVYNMQGEPVLTLPSVLIQGADVSLDGFPAGIYLVRISGPSFTESVRIVKL